ncbi:hypothetical protein [Phocaeicola salanitronis]|uniref:hypothetical protein n=1 Tax=Phocaeicola salanitronis TaxID=376805 RepID=UPI0023F7791F|nr:hypothetical protein [Phocaeicola salanitronis]
MWVIIIIIIAGILIYNIGKKSGETIGRVNNDGGMRLKYARLLHNILTGHKDSRIMTETRTYIKAGVDNYGGRTIFHIQQCPNNTVMIDYEVSNNPVIPSFRLRFTFPDTMNQDLMMEQIVLGIQKKMNRL